MTLMHVINDEEVNIWGKKQLLGTNKRMDQSKNEKKNTVKTSYIHTDRTK